jgi:Cu/Ag efflux protein CusF
MKIIKSVMTISTLLLATASVFAASHAGVTTGKDAANKETLAPLHTSSITADMADGEVRKIDKENKKMTIKHGEIKNLDMPGMTMVFQIRETSLLETFKAGDKVKFFAEKLDGGFVVTGMQLAK